MGSASWAERGRSVVEVDDVAAFCFSIKTSTGVSEDAGACEDEVGELAVNELGDDEAD